MSKEKIGSYLLSLSMSIILRFFVLCSGIIFRRLQPALDFYFLLLFVLCRFWCYIPGLVIIHSLLFLCFCKFSFFIFWNSCSWCMYGMQKEMGIRMNFNVIFCIGKDRRSRIYDRRTLMVETFQIICFNWVGIDFEWIRGWVKWIWVADVINLNNQTDPMYLVVKDVWVHLVGIVRNSITLLI